MCVLLTVRSTAFRNAKTTTVGTIKGNTWCSKFFMVFFSADGSTWITIYDIGMRDGTIGYDYFPLHGTVYDCLMCPCVIMLLAKLDYESVIF